MSASKPIVRGDADYDTIWDVWVENGRSSTFDRQGEFGGALYHVIQTGDEYPTIYQTASLGPTTFDENSAAEKPITEGWHLLNRNWMRLKAKWTYEGKIVITAPEIPNEL